MILLVNPRATRPVNRRFPLSLMAVGAALPDERTWEIIDGNRPDVDVLATIADYVERQTVADPVQRGVCGMGSPASAPIRAVTPGSTSLIRASV